jgi:branched-chain amino acid transport system substrate-binding protein
VRLRAAALLVVLVVSGCGLAAPVAGLRRTVQVALVSDFSGPGAVVGQQVENSLQLEAQRIDASGGLLGAEVEVEAADDQGDPARAAQMVQDQLSREEVGLLVGPTSTATFAAAAPAIARSRLPACTVEVADAVLQQTAFSPSPADADRLAALLDYARSRLNGAALGLIDQGDVAGQADDRLMAADAPRFGLRYLGAQAVVGGNPAAAVQQLEQRGAAAVVVTGDPQLAAAVASTIQQLGLEGKLALLGLDGMAGYDFLHAAGAAAGGAVFASANQAYLTGTPATSWPAGYRDFVTAVENQFGRAPNGVEMMGLPEAADCLLQWSLAVRRAGTFAGSAVIRAWEGLAIPRNQTAEGVPERLSVGRRLSVGAAGVFLYAWESAGGTYRLRQLS